MLFNYFTNNNFFDNYSGIENAILLHFSEIRGESEKQLQMHYHEHIEIFYFLSGQGFFVTPEKKYQVKPHDIIIVNANQLHTEYSLSKENALQHFIIGVDNINLFNTGALLPPKYKNVFHASFGTQNNPFYNYYQKLYGEFKQVNPSYILKSKAILIELLIDILRLLQIDTTEQKISSNAVVRTKEYIDKHFPEDFTLDDLAANVYASKYNLSRKFKETYRYSPMQYLSIRRIQEAKKLLRETDLPITEISGQVGFNQAVYFTKIFKSMVGITPHKYRITYESIRQY